VEQIPVRRALLSVSDKAGLVDFAKALAARGVEIVSTGGTAKALSEAGVPVVGISDVTGFPEMLEGRVKTLHPKVHGGILADRDKPEHMATIAEHGIGPIDLVCVNLYPFAATVAKPDVTLEDAVENIDIGGPSMVRSAAKNHHGVAIVVEPSDYQTVLDELARTGGISLATRKRLPPKGVAPPPPPPAPPPGPPGRSPPPAGPVPPSPAQTGPASAGSAPTGTFPPPSVMPPGPSSASRGPAPSTVPPGAPSYGAQAGTFPAASAVPPGQSGGRQAPAAPGGGSKRRTFLLLGAAVAVVALVVVVAVRLTGGGSGGASEAVDRTGMPLDRAPSGEPEEAWRVDLDGVNHVAGDGSRVFVVAWDGEDTELVAYDRSGNEEWREGLPAGFGYVRSIDGVLVAAGEGESTETAGYDPATGARRWRSDAFPVWPLGGGDFLGNVYDGESRTVRMSLGDGETRWEVDGFVLARCGDVALLGANGGGEVLAVDVAGGEELWHADGSNAECGDGAAVVADDGRLVAYGLRNGEERWRARASSVVDVADGLVVASDDGEAVVLDLSDGDERWSADGYPNTVTDGRVVVSDDSSRYSLYSLRDGEELGRAPRDTGLTPVRNGWLGTGYDESSYEVTLFDRDMRERWSVTLDRDGSSGYADGLLWVVEGDELVIYR